MTTTNGLTRLFGALMLALSVLSAPAAAQQSSRFRPLDEAQTSAAKPSDIILPHIQDSHAVELPCFNREEHFVCEWQLPRWHPVTIGGVSIDLSPTKHVVMLIVASILCCALLITAARIHARHEERGQAPGGLSGTIEAMVLYMRNEVIIPGVGPHGERYVPYLLTVFFFILFANLLGLIPFGSTATGNISVTAMLAIIAFFVIEGAGIRELGPKYIGTIIYWPHDDMNVIGKLLLSLIMTPVEIIGKFTKPFALCIRLFANMTAGHVMVLALISMTFAFGWLIGLAPVLMAVAIMLLELFVAFLQAYVFTLLVSAFIGQMRTAHH